MQAAFQTLTGTLGAVSFSIIFNVRGKKLAVSAAGAAVSWMVYLFFVHMGRDKALGLLGATVTAAILSEIFARIVKVPVMILLVPMIMPLVPGGDLYYATTWLVQGNRTEAGAYLTLLIREAGAIAFGIILVTCIVQVGMRVIHHFSKKS